MVTVQIRDNALSPDLLYAGLSIDGEDVMYVIRDKNGFYMTKSEIFYNDGWCWTEMQPDKMPDLAPYIWESLDECRKIHGMYADNAEIWVLFLDNLRGRI